MVWQPDLVNRLNNTYVQILVLTHQHSDCLRVNNSSLFSSFIPQIYSLMEIMPVTCLKQIFFTVRMEESKGSDKSLKNSVMK